jgi:predicted RNase H-like HicB family nuclease
MEEITLRVQRDEQSGCLVAWWDDPRGLGGITTQGQDLRDLQEQITEAIAVHFGGGGAPRRIRVHFVSDPIIVQS